MNVQEFPELRSAAAASLVGRAINWMARTCRAASEDAVVARTIDRWYAAARQTPPAQQVQTIALMIAVAALGMIALSTLIAADQRTMVPWYGLVAVALLAVAAASRPDAVIRYWAHSRLQRITRWLRDS